MKPRHRIVPVLLFTFGISLGGGLPDRIPMAIAQSSDRESGTRSGGDSSRRDEGRDERRDSWRSRFSGGEGYRGRDSRSSRDRDDGGPDHEETSSRGSLPSSAISGTTRPTTSTADSATSMNMTDYAKSLVKQHDNNGNMMLDGDERRELRGRAALADSNNDNVITIDELVAQLSTSSSSTSSSSSRGSEDTSDESSERRDRERSSFSFRRGDRDRDSEGERSSGDSNAAVAKRVFTGSVGGSQTGKDDKNKRRTYRFTPPAERLPTGLPSWFKSRDANGDGQVSMSEYSRSWNARPGGASRGNY
jgi:hypothetical protein